MNGIANAPATRTCSANVTENGRRAKYYRLTARGRRQLGQETDAWRRLATAVEAVLRTT